MSETNYIELIDEIYSIGKLDYFLVALISADSITDVKACNNSIVMLEKCIDALPYTNIGSDEQERLIDTCEKGIEICKQTKQELLSIS